MFLDTIIKMQGLKIFLVDEKALLIKRRLIETSSTDFVEVKDKYISNPEKVYFERKIFDKKTKLIKGKTNFELIYSGIDGETINILYREFTNDNIARPSFFQNLTYSKKNNKIRFRDLIIRIDSVDNEKIVFTVLSD